MFAMLTGSLFLSFLVSFATAQLAQVYLSCSKVSSDLSYQPSLISVMQPNVAALTFDDGPYIYQSRMKKSVFIGA